MNQVPTIKIKHGDDYMVINEADFDASAHDIYGEPKADTGAGTADDRGTGKKAPAGGKK